MVKIGGSVVPTRPQRLVESTGLAEARVPDDHGRSRGASSSRTRFNQRIDDAQMPSQACKCECRMAMHVLGFDIRPVGGEQQLDDRYVSFKARSMECILVEAVAHAYRRSALHQRLHRLQMPLPACVKERPG